MKEVYLKIEGRVQGIGFRRWAVSKAREVGGLAPCGQNLCCSKYSYDFNSVSINMAKNQYIALNTT